ncbi:MAG: cell division protein FtsZ [Rickettsiales bacterium]|nr:cell division protein FtsZ [Rickettsiales bacterium]
MSDLNQIDNTKPRITVIGVGGAGGNAVNNMIRANLEGVDFLVCNTDAQALRESLAEKKIQIGNDTTQGLGAGSKPDMGRLSAEEDIEEVMKQIKGSHMLFVTAGMGGGTGTGAAPVIAKAAREMGVLTIGVVTKPFNFEGIHRMKTAEKGIEEIQNCVDTLIVIPNQNLFRLATDTTTFADAFNMADNVLHSGVRGVTDLMIMPGLINLDFADVKTVMSEMGKAMMGTGEAENENRAIEAAEAAIANPLLDEVSMRGAKGVLINITGGLDMTLFEVDEAANRIREEVDESANIIFGSTFDEKMSGRMRVSVVATGIDAKPAIKKTFGEQMSFLKTPSDQERNISASSMEANSQPEIAPYELGGVDAIPTQAQEGLNEGVAEKPEGFRSQVADDEKLPETHSPKKKSFLERWGLGKKRSTQEEKVMTREDVVRPQPGVNSSHQPMQNMPSEQAPYENMFDQPQGSEKKEQDDLDIPAFLRAKKKK